MKKFLLNNLVVMGMMCGSVWVAGSALASGSSAFYGNDNYTTVTPVSGTGIDLSSRYNGITIELISNKEATITCGDDSFKVSSESSSLPVNQSGLTWSDFSMIAAAFDDTETNPPALYGNVLKVTDGTIDSSTLSLYGAYSEHGVAGGGEGKGNTVIVSVDTTGDIKAIYGGYGGTGASYNSVTVDESYEGTVAGCEGVSVAGGYANAGGYASNNTVRISGGTYKGKI